MKKLILMGLGLTAMLTVACTSNEKPAEVPTKSQTQINAEETVLENIMTRTTCRAFQNKPVEKEKVEVLLQAGMAAPTALNAQPWHFIVIDDRDVLAQLGTASPHTGVLTTAPMAIAVCGNTDKKLPTDEGVYWIQDVAAATENILLAAHAMGLGATWTGSYPVESRFKIAKAALQLPDNIKSVSIVALGYPAIEPQVKDKWNPNNVSYNKYESHQK